MIDTGETKLEALERTLETGRLYYLQQSTIHFIFKATAKSAARLLMRLSDTSPEGGKLKVALNSCALEALIPTGYGLQKEDPEHYAKPAELDLRFPVGTVMLGENDLCITVETGWFSWDALLLLAE